MGMGGDMAEMMQTMNGWLGDRVLVNGQVQPTIDVDRRSYRLRLLNGSNARIYKLAWSDDSPITMHRRGGRVARTRADDADVDARARPARGRAARSVGAVRRAPSCSCAASRSPRRPWVSVGMMGEQRPDAAGRAASR